MTPSLLLYCRPGFEDDCSRELATHLQDEGEWENGDGYVLFTPNDYAEAQRLLRELSVDQLIFARQMVFAVARVKLGERDRLGPLLSALGELPPNLQGPWSEVWLEHPDSDAGKQLSGFCKRFGSIVAKELAEHLGPKQGRWRLHLFYPSMEEVFVCIADPARSSPWPLGIARVRMPTGAPSRSTLKLSEAFMVLVPDAEQKLKAGMVGVDLGAAPGGWTFQLVSRGLKVFAIDNGPMKGDMAIHPYVKHLREDGFKYKPQHPVDWLVCDMVEQPQRIAALIARWFASGMTRHAVFNLKLPMKKRWQEIERCFDLIDNELDAAGIQYTLIAKQLYHDREEITCYLGRPSGRQR
ncbi:23S rRNA (cytidine2498-2'-O)-methyltransferase [Andreprevotia lacus DSM 23236]|jgi:23S rRNA (cytidine2498-2'-O)-methyltransferase|uniref:23S rRNA (Cytidine2498-2'-O)-methyltransferase n=1 Tax=Andreprevotia lacus DSM 23236 TaxID=1121001 RepID=A0A1W1XZD5_9NEIS|nr:23S rRNA (cytidine(2498)-2'-O)-methyltransferase RlmM [Andreprevotia lacus]SMC28891.1 23S rRNA (cytidine2498-2'-O)-methyltransferase [Andreprevotia lacus DSM 23236]